MEGIRGKGKENCKGKGWKRKGKGEKNKNSELGTFWKDFKRKNEKEEGGKELKENK